jgi:4-amino-4-deoxy-L-arabinose transferase-like glycosyltransferase
MTVMRRDRLIGFILFAAAVSLRAYQFGRTGLDHYDEGVYALSAADVIEGIFPSFAYPGQLFISPPTYFLTTAFTALATGLATDRAAILVNVVFGALTAVLIWRIAAAWLGPAAGLTAGVLTACSQYHIGLSRSGLTDVVFAFWLLLGLYLLAEALRSPRWTLAVAAGLAIGLAWNTKYHGWLAWAMVVPAWIAARWSTPASVDDRRAVRVLLVAGAVAALCIVPWGLYILQQTSVQEFFTWYRGYTDRTIVSLGRTALLQLRQQLFYSGWLDWASLAVSCTVLVVSRSISAVGRGAAVLAVAFLALAVWGESWLLTAPLAVVGGVMLLAGRANLGQWALLSLFGSWCVLLPLYRPYPRLALPLVLGCYVLAGAAVARVSRPGTASARQRGWTLACLVLGLGGAAFTSSTDGNPWRSSDGLRRIADHIATALPEGARVVVRHEPSLAYYLSRAGYDALSYLDTERGRYERGTGTPHFETISSFLPVPPSDGAELVGRWSRIPPNHRLLDEIRPPYPDPRNSPYLVSLYRLPD